MNIRIKSLIGLIILSVVGAAAANAQPVQNTDTGHYYEVVAADMISWPDAKTAAESMDCITPDGMADATCSAPDTVFPHLATITSSREDVFVEGERQTSDLGEVWVGGFQDPITTPGAGDNWTWENGEGTFPGDNLGPEYANWQSGEPNDNGGLESYLGIGLFGDDKGWNDERPLSNIDGYVVEWDVPRILEDCEGGGGCTTIEGHTLTFPEGSIPAGETLSFNSFEFLDPRVAAGTCGTATLTILGATGIGPVTDDEMRIPAYLCGSPKFIIVTVDTGAFFLEEGTVLVENDTATVLPGNSYPDGGVSVCEDPISQVQFTDGDPQYQDVVVWQTTDPDEMLETTTGPGVGGAGQFFGAAGEFSNECGSIRARVKGGSNFGIGFHIDFGPNNTWAGNQAGNFNSFVALTRYKLELALQSVKDARTDGAIKQGDFEKMQQQLKNAIEKLDQGNYVVALAHVNKFLKFVNKANYTTVTGENHNGEHLMRGGNAEFMLRVKIIPYAGP